MMNFEEDIAFAITIASKEIADSFNNVVLSYGVTRSQCVAMYYISKSESITQKDLASYMHIRESTMTGLLDRLQRDGLIERKVNSEDMRKKSIYLSQKGKKKLREIEDIAIDFVKCSESDLSEEDIRKFKEIITKMENSTNKWEKANLKSF